MTYSFTPRAGIGSGGCLDEGPTNLSLQDFPQINDNDVVCSPRPGVDDVDEYNLETWSSRLVSMTSGPSVFAMGPNGLVLEELTPLFGLLECDALAPVLSTSLPLLARTPTILDANGDLAIVERLCALSLYTDALGMTPYSMEVAAFDFDTCVADRAGSNRTPALAFDLVGGGGFLPTSGGTLGPLVACRGITTQNDDHFVYFYSGDSAALQVELRFRHYTDGDLDLCVTPPTGPSRCVRSISDDERFTLSNPSPGLYDIQVFCDRGIHPSCGNVYELIITPSG